MGQWDRVCASLVLIMPGAASVMLLVLQDVEPTARRELSMRHPAPRIAGHASVAPVGKPYPEGRTERGGTSICVAHVCCAGTKGSFVFL
jgi:hypothetical protein